MEYNTLDNNFYFHRLWAKNKELYNFDLENDFERTLGFLNFNNGNFKIREVPFNKDFFYVNNICYNYFVFVQNLASKKPYYLKKTLFYYYIKDNLDVIKSYTQIPIIYFQWIFPELSCNIIRDVKKELKIENKVLILDNSRCNINDKTNMIKNFPSYGTHEINYRNSCKNHENNIIEKSNNILNSKKTHKFICLNRKDKPWRSLLLTQLYDKDILSYTKYSFKGEHITNDLFDVSTLNYNDYYYNYVKENNLDINYAKNLLNIYEKAFKNKNIELDYFNKNENHQSNSYIKSPPYKDMSKCFCFIITDTTLRQEHYTQAVYRSILYGLPFIVSGSYKIIDFLRFEGYDVFDDIIDHSYDNEKNEYKRLKMVLNSIEKINNYSINNLNVIYDTLKPRLKYNRDHFLNKSYNKIENDLRMFLLLEQEKT